MLVYPLNNRCARSAHRVICIYEKNFEDLMSKLNCWILIGAASVRKGSVIRALTGIGSGRDARIELNGGHWLHLDFAAITSINESANPPVPSVWVQNQLRIKPKGTINILVPFRTFIKSGFNAEDYVIALDAAGARMQSIITLCEEAAPWVPEYGVPYSAIPNSQWTPTATTVKLVREFWGWA